MPASRLGLVPAIRFGLVLAIRFGLVIAPGLGLMLASRLGLMLGSRLGLASSSCCERVCWARLSKERKEAGQREQGNDGWAGCARAKWARSVDSFR